MADEDDHDPPGNITTGVQTPEGMRPAVRVLDGVGLDLLQGLGGRQRVICLHFTLEVRGRRQIDGVPLVLALALAATLPAIATMASD